MIHFTNIALEMQVPESLTLRDTSFSWIIGAALFFCLVLLAMARVRQSNVYLAVSVGMIKTQGLRLYLRDAMPLLSGSSLLLLVNYWVSSGLILYLLTTHWDFGLLDTWLVAITTPLILLFFHLFSLGLSGWVTGESDVFKTPFAMKMLGAQVLGIIYFLCALVWVLKPEYVDITINVVLWAFIIESSFRIVKSVSLVLQQGISWYYIILYFCTLEILPYMVFYHYVMRNLLE